MIKDSCKQIIWDWGKPGFEGDKEVRRGLIDIFQAISEDPAIEHLPGVTHILPCYDENSGLVAGDWAPELHLVLRKVADEHPTTDGGEEA
ncbi:MAG: hypothetical protein ACYSWO_29310, partial [Planctomycetota bacterium]